MIIRNCVECGNKFYFKNYPSSLNKGEGKFCSRKCQGIWHHKNFSGKKSPQWKGGLIIKKCETCGNEIKIKPHVKKNGFGKYCSRACYFTWRKTLIGNKSPSWKGGKITKVCQMCGEEFQKALGAIKQGRGKFCSRPCSSLWTIQHSKKQGTSIEIKMEMELIRRGIIFQKQYPIWHARTIPDFFITPNICVYCDGDFWHNLPNTKAKDRQQDFTLKFLGYKVYRFWEHDINKSISKCVDKIKEISQWKK